jgi:hypothetical protein
MIRIIVLGAIGFFYISIIPHYIQGGDTSELVAGAYHRLIVHPPGYPLYLWLQHVWMRGISFSSVFWRAGVLNTIFGISCLYLVSKPILNQKIPWALIVLSLGLQSELIEASVLPDVFSLHGLFTAGLGILFLYPRKNPYIWLPALFFISFSNHLTAILLLPCYLYALWSGYRNSTFLKSLLISSLVGIATTVLLYLSLFSFQTDHPLSWGNLQQLSDLLKHILRVDYGTFKLSTGTEHFGKEALALLLSSIWPLLLPAGLVLITSFQQGYRPIKDSRFLIWTSCLLLTLLFPLMMNIDPRYSGEEILRRFHVMPILTLGVWMVYLITQIKWGKKTLILAMFSTTPIIFLNLSNTYKFQNLAKDSIIEDYSRNIFRLAQQNAPAVLVLDSDSAYFGARYIQAFETENKASVAVVSLPLFFHPWYIKKVVQSVPSFVLPQADKIYRKRELNQDQDIIHPNLEQINFIFTRDYKNGAPYHVSFLPVGRMLSPGEGVSFKKDNLQINHRPTLNQDGIQNFTKLKLFYEYSHYYLARGAEYFQSDNMPEAIKHWEKALEQVPYAYPAMVNLCEHRASAYSFCTTLGSWEEATRGLYP